MATPAAYDAAFYSDEAKVEGPTTAALVGQLYSLVHPASVVDVGCGVGAFLREFLKVGATDVVGIEGSWVTPALLAVEASRIQVCDLTAPVVLDRTFDLALCLEVAEHLPPRSADGLVNSLVRLAPVVAFSAAVPLQGGTDHVNERWPEYWARKFRAQGYVAVDCVRARLAKAPGIVGPYVQNTVLYVRADLLEGDPRFTDIRNEVARHVPFRPFVPGRPVFTRAVNLLPEVARASTYVVLGAALSVKRPRYFGRRGRWSGPRAG